MAVTLWLAAGLLCFAVVVPLILALRRAAAGGDGRLSYDLALYRDQLAELGRDQESGLLTGPEAAAARVEIERRMLAAGEAAANGARVNDAISGRRISSGVTALVLVIGVPGLALLLYLQVGQPGAPDEPLRSRPERQLLASDGTLDLDKTADALRRRVAQSPDSVEGWLLLARTEAARGRWSAARDAMEHGVSAVPADDKATRSAMRGAYGEMLVGAANGTVTPEAKQDFEQAVALEPSDVRARYFLGLAMVQAGDKVGGIAAWQALARDNPSDAPFQPVLRSQIVAAGGTPVPALAPAGAPASPAGQAIAALPAAQQQQAIRGMVEGLAAKMVADPTNHDGWMRLGGSWATLGEPRRAADAYGRAAALQPDDLPTLQAYAQALRTIDPADPRLPDLDRRLGKLRGG